MNIEFALKNRYKTIRSGMRGVRDEVYTLFTILSSTYHMSARQIEGAICETSNILFGRNFKPYSPNSTVNESSVCVLGTPRPFSVAFCLLDLK